MHKRGPMRQGLRAAQVLIFIDDFCDKLVGILANFVDGIKWLVAYVPWKRRIHTDFDKFGKCPKIKEIK